MLSNPVSSLSMGRAEKAFRDAFERLKQGRPERLLKGANVSQNNVAKEAGCDTSALRKTRFPSLVAEIQRWINEHKSDSPNSPRQAILAQRSRNRSLQERIESLKVERDHALSLLVEADALILELKAENGALKSRLPDSNVTPITGRLTDRSPL